MKLKPISFRDILEEKLSDGLGKDFEIKVDQFSDDSARWLEIIKRVNNKEVSITISFDEDYNDIKGIEIFSSPLIPDVDDTEKII